ncbi:hypothetical protein SLEP1_g6549 [Rubroshorea leprosula]|uniref:NAB domain-containing protein n=2 Tax=Rubroshorea leprosula TaxID=152421 RepID=A0AAV5HVW3_9ROSI|nr:hypothetical protein SLEP1_g6549 [Rubroshorea leprosula]
MDTEHRRKPQAAAFSWRRDSHLLMPTQSPWLHNTLSDVNDKTNAILKMIQDDNGDSFAKRAEMYYQNRPELIRMIQEFQKSYHSLAEKYDHLRSQLLYSSPSITKVDELQKTKQENTLMTSDQNEKNDDHHELIESGVGSNASASDDDIQRVFWEKEKLWDGLRLKVSELVEDNLRLQAELIRRNDEKREVIKDLSMEMNRVVDENRVLKVRSVQSHHYKVTKKIGSTLSRLKKLILGKVQRAKVSLINS